MVSEGQLAEYLEAIREDVCSLCIDRPPGGPPCEPLGKRCWIELNLPQLIDAVHSVHSEMLDPYLDALDQQVCAQCAIRTTDHCPCPLEYLIELAVQSIEAVDERRVEAMSLFCSVKNR